MPPVRRLTAILAADVAGYSRLMGADEEGTHERLKAHLGELVDPKIKEHRGRVIKTTGDGFLAEFASVVDAVRCAVEVQRGMAERNAAIPPNERIEFRVGINLGDVIAEEHDIFGDGVNVAARLEGLAEPGGICVSRVVRDQVRDKVAFAFEDLGEQTVKNIGRPVRVYRVRDRAIPIEQPLPPSSQPLPLPDKPSIAVLPFQNMSGDPEQDYFADGMVEEIITALSRVRWLFVIARNSSFTYKGNAVDVRQVARELGVRYVLEGSVRKSGNRVRITAQLIDASTSNHVWAERFERELANIFAVQDEIAAQVVATIEPELYAAEDYRSRRKPPENLDAWECVMRALSCIGQGTILANTQAEALCRRALAIKPDYGQAHSLLAWVLLRPPYGGSDLKAFLHEAFAEAATALKIDERDAWAHLTHGIALWRMRRHGDAERAFRRALEFNPSFALALSFLGCTLAVQGAHEEANTSAERALRLSPVDRIVSAYASFAMVFACIGAERYADSLQWARRLVEQQPGNVMANHLPVAAAALNNDDATVEELLPTMAKLQPDLSLAWVKDNTPLAGVVADRVLAGLRKAGMPEE
jgi:adenylate cyclase